MTVDGLLEAAFVAWGNVVTLLALFITIISGYLVVAYIAGDKLTKPQVTLINIIYIAMGGFVGWGCREMSLRASAFEDAAYNMASGPVGDLISRGEVATAIISSFGLAYLASLKFMWDIRHSKT